MDSFRSSLIERQHSDDDDADGEPYASYSKAFHGEKSPQMCGQSMMNMLWGGKSPNNSQPFDPSGTATKTCLTPPKAFNRRRYTEVGGPLRSPEDTESSSSSDADEALQQIDNNANSYMVQFDPNDMKKSEEEKEVLAKVRQQQQQRAQAAQSMGFRPTPWLSSLPAVTEEPSSFDTEEQSHQSGKMEVHGPPAMQISPRKAAAPKHTSPEKNEMLTAMRSLVLKQQEALRELSHENQHYRTKLGEYQNMLIKMKQDQAATDSVVNQLKLEKEAFEAEAMWLREEIRAVKAHVEDMDDDDLQFQLKSLMVGGKNLGPGKRSLSADRAADNAFASFQSSLKAPQPHQENSSVLDRAVQSLACSPSSAWRWAESRDDKEQERPKERPTLDYGISLEDDAPRDELLSYSRTTSSSSSPAPRTWSDGREVGARGDFAKEEVNLFKERLETIQKKRSERQTGRKQLSKRNVRFGTITV